MRPLIALSLLASAVSASAVIVNGTPGQVDSGFLAYVGSVGDASGIYLGQSNGAYWVLTADHVGGGGVGGFYDSGGTFYSAVSGSGGQIGNLDLYLFQINVTAGSALAGLNPLMLAQQTFAGGTVYMAGYGGSGQSTTIGNFGGYEGYSYTVDGRELHWGTGNGSIGSGGPEQYDEMELIQTIFSKSSSGSGVGVKGDSGGGFFQKVGNDWVLVGLMAYDNLKNGVEAGVVVFNDTTYAIDLGAYSSQIQAAMIPEPGTVGLLFTVAAVGLVWKGRRLKQQ